jgi:hypothetical protein
LLWADALVSVGQHVEGTHGLLQIASVVDISGHHLLITLTVLVIIPLVP